MQSEQFLQDNLYYIGQTNTQMRRLGYVVQICQLLNDNYFSMSELQRELQDWAEDNQEKLNSHVSNKGVIQRSRQSLGSRRYIELTENFELITPIGGYFRLTKTGRVLNALLKDCPKNPFQNPFEIGQLESLFLLYQLMILDRDYLLPIFELTLNCHEQNQLQKETQSKLIEHFQILRLRLQSQMARFQAEERISALRHWTKAIRYSEHLTVPRLNWLLDLKMLNWTIYETKGEFVPSKMGRIFLDGIPTSDNNRFIDRWWCQNDLFAHWAKAQKLPVKLWKEFSLDEQRQLIEENVEIGFEIFRTMQYPRISAYQLTLFMVIRFLIRQKILAGFEDIKFALSNFSGAGKWAFYWTEIDDDGFLILPR